MKGTRHSEEQIIAILKEGAAALTTAELCRQHGISGEDTHGRPPSDFSFDCMQTEPYCVNIRASDQNGSFQTLSKPS